MKRLNTIDISTIPKYDTNQTKFNTNRYPNERFGDLEMLFFIFILKSKGTGQERRRLREEVGDCGGSGRSWGGEWRMGGGEEKWL